MTSSSNLSPDADTFRMWLAMKLPIEMHNDDSDLPDEWRAWNHDNPCYADSADYEIEYYLKTQQYRLRDA